MRSDKQDPLFPKGTLPEQPTFDAPPLTSDSSLKAALGQFEQHMQEEGFAANTVKAFASDIRLLGKHLGIGQPVGEIGTKNLNDFLFWLMYERGIPCSPKSYARRVTSLKVFFAWLRESGVLVMDPAAAVIQNSVTSPLPKIPSADQLTQALAVTQSWRNALPRQKADARPHLLLTLLLQTGIKKGEAMAIVPNHIDRTTPGDPFLFIRYKNPRLRYKERKVSLEPEWLDVLDEYLIQYPSNDTLFTCTARNLEYILTDVGNACALEQGLLSFENLRWASALSDFKQGIEPDEIRQRLGLSKITWRETKKKLEKLKEQP
ncbi:MAG: phage integrase N-terminal SAM-like domain-containing protein [Chloroflexi bacterium]|nr:phage integrase N-terminal SAM-like domain-containing protein [Chloroflexota bacterium]MBP8054822.1 phage integrase N-terminal SAM-like domain-containing protein [Chloroflexota bacterium]